MNTTSLDYDLPPDLIAQHPCEPRDAARLLIVDRKTGQMQIDIFRNVARYLPSNSCLVMNDTRVIRARLHAQKPTGGTIEIFLLRETEPGVWTALVRPSARVKPGTQVTIAETVNAHIEEILPEGRRKVRFNQPNVLELLESIGEIPLPPYIHRDRPESSDLTRYQTIYAKSSGAVAAPTAGLHFTPEVFASLDTAGIQRTTLTLHVGYGTFRPITVDRLEDHVVDVEEYEVSETTAAQLNATRAAGHQIVAIGTTSSRTLETLYRNGTYHAGHGMTGLYIHPPYTFQAVDILQTNFHLPRSSLLALVSAFMGHDLMLEAYRLAIRERFRFYSYGDAMLIL